MANIFEKYAADREAEQKKIEKAVVADTRKMMAAERETTIAAIIHEWVQEHQKEVEK